MPIKTLRFSGSYETATPLVSSVPLVASSSALAAPLVSVEVEQEAIAHAQQMPQDDELVEALAEEEVAEEQAIEMEKNIGDSSLVSMTAAQSIDADATAAEAEAELEAHESTAIGDLAENDDGGGEASQEMDDDGEPSAESQKSAEDEQMEAAAVSSSSGPAATAVVTAAASSGTAAAAAAAARDEMMQVYLRLRPLTEAERKVAGEAPVISVESQTTVRVHAPESSQSFKNGERSGAFTFSRVFDETVCQAQLFDAILAQPVTKAVMAGKHAHVFAYGACM